MGREISATVRWQGQSTQAKALLESAELILRGGHKARLPRTALSGWSAAEDGLHLSANGAPLHIAMTAPEAARWVVALDKAPPSLAAKLGIGPDRPVRLIGSSDDAALAAALDGAVAEPAGQVIAVVLDAAGLVAALREAAAAPGLPIWCIYAKGKAAEPGDAAIRSAFRDAGWIDSKSCAVSDRLTATRYSRQSDA